MKTRRVLVTGAMGLIGRAVVRRLTDRGDAVIAVARPRGVARLPGRVATVEVDLARPEVTELATLGPFDAVIHLAQAAGWHDFPRNAGQVAAVSLTATAYLAELAVSVGAKVFVLASSGGIYGPSPIPILETAPIRPAQELGFYLAAKAAAEQLLGFFSPQLTVHILRPFFVYGPSQVQSFLVPRLIHSVRYGTPIRVNGGRGARVNPIHVDDAANAFVAALDLSTPLVANIAGPNIVNVREIADLAAMHLGKSARFQIIDSQPDDFVADTTVMSARLGKAAIEFGAGLCDLLSSTYAAHE
jgi:UDP-glucose 4-epimerase